MTSESEIKAPKPKIYSRDQHTVSRRDIDPDALKIMYRLNRYGYKAYLVGGGVRDVVLGKKPKDFDIATDARPRQIKSLFRNSRIIGRRFKLIHVYFRGSKIIEVSTFRDFQETEEGELPEEERMLQQDNIYGSEASDAVRRDLTINALFYSIADFSIIDYVGGMDDLENKVVRMIGDPDVRLLEDPVRLMRVVRHAVKAGFSIEPDLINALSRHSALIKQCPPMRVYDELRKDFGSGYALGILQSLDRFDILKHLLPELSGKNTDLHTPSSAIAECLLHIDELVSDGMEVSVTTVLSIITLCAGLPGVLRKDLLSSITHKDELSEIVSHGFTELAVPRKERERIEKTLHLWYQMEHSDPEKLKINSLAHRSAIDDVSGLLQGLYFPGESPLPEIAAKAVKARKNLPKRKRRKKFRSSKTKSRGRTRKPRF